MTRRARNSVMAGLALALLVGGVSATWAATRSSHGDPDPGGHILSSLRTIERALPADAQVLLRQGNEPRWDSCDGRAGTFGWADITVAVQFRTSDVPRNLVANVDKVLRATGWQQTEALHSPLGPGARWSRTVAGSAMATAMLAPGTRGDGTGTYWDLDAVAPPHGHRVSGC